LKRRLFLYNLEVVFGLQDKHNKLNKICTNSKPVLEKLTILTFLSISEAGTNQLYIFDDKKYYINILFVDSWSTGHLTIDA
jgi:hypothetical protein